MSLVPDAGLRLRVRATLREMSAAAGPRTVVLREQQTVDALLDALASLVVVSRERVIPDAVILLDEPLEGPTAILDLAARIAGVRLYAARG